MTIILKTLGGSRCYGTHMADSDYDYVQVTIDAASDVLNPGHVGSRPRHTKTADGDLQSFPLLHFLHVASQGNPAALETLWAPVIAETPIGTSLLDISGAFVSRLMVPRYRGYMKAQTLRLLGLKGQLRVTREELRNAHGYDSKYAMHTLRLGWQCLELLANRQLELPMPQHDERTIFLRAVREGKVPFNAWWEKAIALDAAIGAAARTTTVPDEPDRELIRSFSIQAHMRTWLDVTVEGRLIW